jgi:2-(1,2-epoxy-1,2-dihydrophenyl)acetyl-CoA isomerase
MSIALACDFRIAASSARLVGGWAPLAFSGDLGGPWLLARRVGHAKALELLAMNTTVDAEMGRDLGLFDRVVADDEFDRAWREWAGAFAAGPRTAIGYMKTNIRQAWTMSLSDAVAAEAEHQVAASASPDHREGVRAWIEKRPPRFGQRGEDRRLGDGAVGAAPT